LSCEDKTTQLKQSIELKTLDNEIEKISQTQISDSSIGYDDKNNFNLEAPDKYCENEMNDCKNMQTLDKDNPVNEDRLK